MLLFSAQFAKKLGNTSKRPTTGDNFSCPPIMSNWTGNKISYIFVEVPIVIFTYKQASNSNTHFSMRTPSLVNKYALVIHQPPFPKKAQNVSSFKFARAVINLYQLRVDNHWSVSLACRNHQKVSSKLTNSKLTI